jgi:hypothetical protein
MSAQLALRSLWCASRETNMYFISCKYKEFSHKTCSWLPYSLTGSPLVIAWSLKGKTKIISEYRITGFFGLFPSSDVLGSINTTFRKLCLFPSSGEGVKNTPTQLGPLEKANLNHWTIEIEVLIFNQRNFKAYISLYIWWPCCWSHIGTQGQTKRARARQRERQRHIIPVLWHYVTHRINKDATGKSRKLAPAMYRSSDGITTK